MVRKTAKRARRTPAKRCKYTTRRSQTRRYGGYTMNDLKTIKIILVVLMIRRFERTDNQVLPAKD